MTFVASAGDNGAGNGPSWPAISPEVLSVGGTTLYLGNGSAYAEKFTGSDGSVRWSNYLVAAGGLVGKRFASGREIPSILPACSGESSAERPP